MDCAAFRRHLGIHQVLGDAGRCLIVRVNVGVVRVVGGILAQRQLNRGNTGRIGQHGRGRLTAHGAAAGAHAERHGRAHHRYAVGIQGRHRQGLVEHLARRTRLAIADAKLEQGAYCAGIGIGIVAILRREYRGQEGQGPGFRFGGGGTAMDAAGQEVAAGAAGMVDRAPAGAAPAGHVQGPGRDVNAVAKACQVAHAVLDRFRMAGGIELRQVGIVQA